MGAIRFLRVKKLDKVKAPLHFLYLPSAIALLSPNRLKNGFKGPAH